MYYPTLIKVSEDQKSILRQLIEFYEYDFSEFNEADINSYGYYGYKYFDHYWTDEDRIAYFVMVNGQYAGFVMVNAHCYIVKEGNVRAISEFFIMRKYRNKGIGKVVAKQIFDTHSGAWEVLQHGNNHISKQFWESVIHDYTNGKYFVHEVKTEHWEGQGITFIKKEG